MTDWAVLERGEDGGFGVLLERVDRFVSAAGMNRSSFFGLAARRMLDQEKGKTIG